ncbi:SGNH/GDSL hydrolase family protein [Spiroplasma culicicola]|uniref:Lipolytic enzyme, GDSL family n=1 Tax=Spiroplasma culicicola AES-1 TaxID=1276246 RepID=W6A6S4_9MOLU|nr:SGNH/GDSL hydrolase family protein [Spiroplasma culicicola]AHI52808.1 lipolytic enzyme, GDSL family [Spiroplasma culicicola AES-1]
MKKLLAFLSSVSIATPIAINVVACVPQDKNLLDPLALKNIGTDIDTSKAVDTSIKGQKITNFFNLGDSLSDTGGKELVDFEKSGGKSKTVLAGLYDQTYKSFSNGAPAGAVLNDLLGFEQMNAGTEWTQTITREAQQRNFSIGGATVSNPLLLSSKTGYVSLEKQARALVAKQKLNKDDLVYIDIGGNDLFVIAITMIAQEAGIPIQLVQSAEEILKAAQENFREAIFTLLNNGARKIVFLYPPDVTSTPMLYKLTHDFSDPTKSWSEMLLNDIGTKIKDIGFSLIDRFTTEINRAQAIYPNTIATYYLYDTGFETVMKAFEQNLIAQNPEWIEGEDYFMTVGWTGGAKTTKDTDENGVEITTMTAVYEIDENHPEEFENQPERYFFFDNVHPTKWVHEYMGNELYNAIQKAGWI